MKVQQFIEQMSQGIDDARVNKILLGAQVATSLEPAATESDIASAGLSLLARWLFTNFSNDPELMQIAMTAIGASLLRAVDHARAEAAAAAGDGGAGLGVLHADPGVIRADGSTEGNVG